MKKRAKIRVDVITLFPRMFEGPLSESLMGRAQKAGILDLRVHDLRKWSVDPRHSKVDDRPYGGGPGMVISPEPVYRALKAIKKSAKDKKKPYIVCLSPQGRVFDQRKAGLLVKKNWLILLCGHYEGLDERILGFINEEISVGDFVLTGGELPAMIIVDAVARLVPGVIGDPNSLRDESFSKGLLDYPHYTRPKKWRGMGVPDVLLSGNHRKIEEWRQNEALRQTKRKRPSLLTKSRR